tara:strand:+ start:2976 stop:3401 length:426 start_codon:yes stop_codon:yes gene_type:complete
MNDETIEWSPAKMLEILLNEPDDFLKIKETLTRIGVSSIKEQNMPTLFQSCHILHKQGRYFIVHFKELFLLDGKTSTLTLDDLARRNTITTLLSDWGLLEICKPEDATPTTSLKTIKVIPHRDKGNWNLQPKYSIGNVKSV